MNDLGMIEFDTPLWVPVILRPQGWWGPDVGDVDFEAEIPGRLEDGLPVRTKLPKDDPSPRLGDPAVKFCRVRVRAVDAPKVTAAILEKNVPEADKLLVKLCALPRLGVTPWMDDKAAETFFSVVPIKTQEQKLAAAKLLLYAVRIGLSAAKAEAIAQALNLVITG